MDMITTSPATPAHSVEPFSLRETPSLIERIWPAQKISAEAQKERKAVAGQTLTALGSYWKGRKPLILVRACILAALLPATARPEDDLAVFELLMQIDDEAFGWRLAAMSAPAVAKLAFDANLPQMLTPADFFAMRGSIAIAAECLGPDDYRRAAAEGNLVWRRGITGPSKRKLIADATRSLSYADRVSNGLRPEELDDEALGSIWGRVNSHLGTTANSLEDLIQQLGVMRFGHRSVVADTFSGGGSIPFESARLGCDVIASDLNPIACMLTWGALNIIGAPVERQRSIQAAETRLAAKVQDEIDQHNLEQDENGNRPKAFLYCLETRCPSSGWMVPMLPSLIVSKPRRVVARLIPDPVNCRYDIEIHSGVSTNEMKSAESGTLQNGYLVHSVDGTQHRTSVKTIRGDFRRNDGLKGNALRLWQKHEIRARADDILQERLYCIQWISAETHGRARQNTYFAAPTPDDLRREEQVVSLVEQALPAWQRDGLVPDMKIEDGKETEGPIRTMGWAYWHQMFSPRAILTATLIRKHAEDDHLACFWLARYLDNNSRSCRWEPNQEGPKSTFDSQALKTFFNYANRPFSLTPWTIRMRNTVLGGGRKTLVNGPASALDLEADLFITDPPYADAVRYEEITEFFIAWLRANPPSQFDGWKWDSRRPLAIKGDGEEFRREMVAAYKAMADHMPENGLQVVMFTHQSGAVWADMAQIFWGAGLQVQAAWYIATETTSELKKGGYVQGTVILVLRKRRGDESGYEDEIAQEVRAEVARQIDTLVGLNQSLKGAGRIENLFEDADLQMAGYAAALRVLTGYTRIDGRDMTAEAVRPRRKGEKGFVERVIEFAVQVANEHMVPEGLTPRLWQQLSGTERFYLKMLDLEAAKLKKLDNYQNFARAFRVPDYTALMADMRPNAARVKRADDFLHRTGFDIVDFGQGIVRAALYGVYQISREVEPDVAIEQVRGMVENYYRRREDLVEVAEYIASKRGRDDEREGRHAAILAQLVRNERLG